MMKHVHGARWLAGVLAAGLLAACGSSVKLDDVQVEDKKGNEVAALAQPPARDVGGGAGATSGSPRTEVAKVDLTQPQGGGQPQASARIIYFDYDSFSIKPEFQSVIEAHARYVRADKARKMQIEGHTDERGGREYNLALGQRRAEAVRKALELLGVTDAQVEAVSFGKEKPVAEGADEEAYAKNRRAELVYR